MAGILSNPVGTSGSAVPVFIDSHAVLRSDVRTQGLPFHDRDAR
jgi:hypothetical protein